MKNYLVSVTRNCIHEVGRRYWRESFLHLIEESGGKGTLGILGDILAHRVLYSVSEVIDSREVTWRIGMEGSIGLILLKSHDLYPSHGKS